MSSNTNNSNNSIMKKMKNMTSSLIGNSKTNNGVSNSNSSSSMNIQEILKYILLIVFIIIFIYVIISAIYYMKDEECKEKKPFFEYLIDFKNRNVCLDTISTELTMTPTNIPKIQDITMTDVANIVEKEEVFHIANQDYTYDQAKCKCESYGGKLATKAQITDAYNNGAHWCTYGWSEGQNAYYPVQQCEWDKIHMNDERIPLEDRKSDPNRFCGKPGINGGFFANPYIKFGVNCYGKKPKGESVIPKKPYCPPMNFCKLESNFEASHKLDTDEITAFAPGRWNQTM